MPIYVSQPNEAASKDTWIYQFTPTTNYGNGTTLYVNGVIAGYRKSTLIWFDLSTIDAGAIIDEAKLYLWGAPGGTGVAGYLDVYRIHSDKATWEELQATWNVYKTANNWTTAGCRSVGNDYFSERMAHHPTGAIGSDVVIDLDPSVFALLLGADGNRGLVIHSLDCNDRAYHSASSATATKYPKLYVQWHMPAVRIIKYLVDVWDKESKVLDSQGRVVAPDKIEANEWIRLIGAGRPSSKVYPDLISDPFVSYIESVSYRMDSDTVRIKATKESMIQSFLKRLGGMAS